MAFACSSSSMLEILVGWTISRTNKPRSMESGLPLDCLPVGSLFLRKTTDSVNLIATEFLWDMIRSVALRMLQRKYTHSSRQKPARGMDMRWFRNIFIEENKMAEGAVPDLKVLRTSVCLTRLRLQNPTTTAVSPLPCAPRHSLRRSASRAGSFSHSYVLLFYLRTMIFHSEAQLTCRT